ncbi:MAG: non-canonical purine NTP pyrophosphatase, partial [Candidatus Rokuibacteriota bacterium]
MTPWLVLATANAAKVRELRTLLDGVGYGIRHLGDFPGLALPPEGPTSYMENARRKAQAAAITGAVALADDSGLE